MEGTKAPEHVHPQSGISSLMLALSYHRDMQIQVKMVKMLLEQGCPIDQVTHKAAQIHQHVFRLG